ncbi:MAG TPA: anti-sigma factor [Amycolatopsis sp.]|uniref:Regulator of SigK n=1 Tax=Amycolatopsis nalaikhensis TaxID=715472 RepID=A0ABY8Y1J4_9PSEU|nr:anti-sigma factor [Amycolatopsis sp. 2-2]WIV61724.1 anti-sigma factor [Amycolatopsis sp. 2-2]
MTAELHMLTGAYALDAVSDVDRAEFERHLGECSACRQEVAELRATGARLAAADAVDPPSELRLTVLAEVARTRQLPPKLPVAGRAKTWHVRFALLGAAAAAVVAVLVGVQTTTVPQAPVDSVLSAPDATTLQGVGEGTATLVVSRSRNQAVLLASGLPALDPAHAYQVWLIGKGGAHSAGLMGSGPMLADLPPGVDRVGITVEPAGGSRGPTTPAVSMISLT